MGTTTECALGEWEAMCSRLLCEWSAACVSLRPTTPARGSSCRNFAFGGGAHEGRCKARSTNGHCYLCMFCTIQLLETCRRCPVGWSARGRTNHGGQCAEVLKEVRDTPLPCPLPGVPHSALDSPEATLVPLAAPSLLRPRCAIPCQ